MLLSIAGILGIAWGYKIETDALSFNPELKESGIGIGSLSLVKDCTFLPTGQIKLQAPHIQHISLCLPNGVSCFLLGPLPVKPIALLPILCSHIRTQSPQRIQSSFFFLILGSLTPYSSAIFFIASESGHLARRSSATTFLALNILSVSVNTFNPFITG